MSSESGGVVEVTEGQEVAICFNRTDNLARESVLILTISFITAAGMIFYKPTIVNKLITIDLTLDVAQLASLLHAELKRTSHSSVVILFDYLKDGYT